MAIYLGKQNNIDAGSKEDNQGNHRFDTDEQRQKRQHYQGGPEPGKALGEPGDEDNEMEVYVISHGPLTAHQLQELGAKWQSPGSRVQGVKYCVSGLLSGKD